MEKWGMGKKTKKEQEIISLENKKARENRAFLHI
jgi:hypothetical protein